jgi:hypothetical protein
VRALQKAYVFRVIATFERERFLRQTALLTQFIQGLGKRSFLWRTIFVSSRHLHAGVCDVSMNTYTKYIIHYLLSGTRQKTGKTGLIVAKLNHRRHVIGDVALDRRSPLAY